MLFIASALLRSILLHLVVLRLLYFSPFRISWLFSFWLCGMYANAASNYTFSTPTHIQTHTHIQRAKQRHAHSICIMEWFLKFGKHIRCVMWRIFGPLFIYLFRLFSLSFVGIAWCLVAGWKHFGWAFPLFGIHFQWCSNVCTRHPHKPRALYVN